MIYPYSAICHIQCQMCCFSCCITLSIWWTHLLFSISLAIFTFVCQICRSYYFYLSFNISMLAIHLCLYCHEFVFWKSVAYILYDIHVYKCNWIGLLCILSLYVHAATWWLQRPLRVGDLTPAVTNQTIIIYTLGAIGEVFWSQIEPVLCENCNIVYLITLKGINIEESVVQIIPSF